MGAFFAGVIMFERQTKFIVAKIDDANQYLNSTERAILKMLLDKVEVGRIYDGKIMKDYVVVAHDWPMYEKVWKMIEDHENNR